MPEKLAENLEGSASALHFRDSGRRTELDLESQSLDLLSLSAIAEVIRLYSRNAQVKIHKKN